MVYLITSVPQTRNIKHHLVNLIQSRGAFQVLKKEKLLQILLITRNLVNQDHKFTNLNLGYFGFVAFNQENIVVGIPTWSKLWCLDDTMKDI